MSTDRHSGTTSTHTTQTHTKPTTVVTGATGLNTGEAFKPPTANHP